MRPCWQLFLPSFQCARNLKKEKHDSPPIRRQAEQRWALLGPSPTFPTIAWLQVATSLSTWVGPVIRKGYWGSLGTFRQSSSLHWPVQWITRFQLPIAIDATRICDNAKVAIKLVKTSSDEIPIIRYLSSGPRISDRRNRTVPIVEIIPLPETDLHALIVMPILLGFHLLPFRRVGEFTEALHQYLQVWTVLSAIQTMTLTLFTGPWIHARA